jgi:hypothetical protein
LLCVLVMGRKIEQAAALRSSGQARLPLIDFRLD